jgi:hypothetical protein
MQIAIPNADAISTTKSSPDEMSLRHCMAYLYTRRQFLFCDFSHELEIEDSE